MNHLSQILAVFVFDSINNFRLIHNFCLPEIELDEIFNDKFSYNDTFGFEYPFDFGGESNSGDPNSISSKLSQIILLLKSLNNLKL